jgi:hypothetical protein
LDLDRPIIGDESEILRRLESKIIDNFPHVRIMHIRTSEHAHEYKEVYYPSRIGYLRNLGLAASDVELFCHLDDDSTYDSDHVSSLQCHLVNVGKVVGSPGEALKSARRVAR